MTPSRDIARLIEIMAALRHPETGCPWDVVQDFRSIAPYTVEEAFEVADAIERGDPDDLREELGDLLLQVVYHARMAEEAGTFDFGAVVEAITTKMIRRHPHVFGDEIARSAGMAKGAWNRIKAEEKALKAARREARGLAEAAPSLLDDVPAGMPGLVRAVKLQDKAGTVGFDWNDPKAVIAKIREELDEIEAEIDRTPRDLSATEAELGDVLFAVANLARHLKLDPEAALRVTNEKFRRRFAHIEAVLAARGSSPAEASLDEMEAIWQEAKTAMAAPDTL
ncbi:nucleoside triphosphate pyrophosphohydrolase [Prosthecomicrobium hirschii]|uniref:nucleoside triphosphate pyrophosphohydrolase n=1 Tax=Prosthecodimorpha hirschii TaxID=665126 RepID=UPI00221F6B83|nr:nucleoside triphosphate pyrophosphohydrolase [Prosthecomicrobium hirschii]MCW1839285.1 nucleoside triphosphate pyrophosphohydrolase [Prosthecomicrobium hirschii]